jgi:hypothetical protein
VYFSTIASYSCDSFSHPVPNGHQLSDGSVLANGAKVVIFAKVTVGKEYASGGNSALRNPPEGFDSIKGGQFYMIYEGANKKTYPMFLVYFN